MPESQPKVSVIVPVYNVEPYIEKCVRTLFGQTLDDMEFIFVDDGSPDRSIEVMQRILEEFPDRKEQVKLIRHNPNAGVARSRQDGMVAATGEYIIHCDPDDWAELDMYESLYQKAKESDADLVICNYSTVSNNGDIIKHYDQQPLEMTSISILESITGRTKKIIHGSTCNKLLKSEHARRGYFPSDISYCEDVYYWFQIFRQDLHIEYLDRYLYYYRSNQSGLVSSDSEISQQRNINLYNRITSPISSSSDQRYILCCKSFICELLFGRFFIKGTLTNKEFTKLFNNANFDLSADKILKRYQRPFLWLAINGYRNQSIFIYRLFQNLKKTLKKLLQKR